jgi:two-component system LytT family response regulator
LIWRLRPRKRRQVADSRARDSSGHADGGPTVCGPSQRADRVIIKNAGQVVFLNVAEIDWIEAADYYACLHVGNHTHLLRRALSELERDLDSEMFCRIHRSIIVNLDRIRRLELKDDGEYEVVLKSNVRLRLSRRFRKALQDRLGVGRRSAGE